MKTALKFLICSLCTAPLLGLASAHPRVEDVQGDWVMHVYLGDRLFEDQIHLERGPDGKLCGTLTVPHRFTVPLRNIEVNQKQISFNIEANEGNGAFHVKYEG